ncbi:hypothetical protein KBTX_04262 [wastewater metagenome]|uniref:Uncharacterized protein n=2 Tax=unclassified sequences TaxID=12908 RepID=A0A5B8RH24_9ZZZZ|nr:hypothetical protein KBTEX_04262 [uncultured organism]
MPVSVDSPLSAADDVGRTVVGERVANQHRLTGALSETERAELDRLLAKWLASFEP